MIELINGDKIYLSHFDSVSNYSGTVGTGIGNDRETIEIDVLSWFSQNDYGVFRNANHTLVIYKDKIVKYKWTNIIITNPCHYKAK